MVEVELVSFQAGCTHISNGMHTFSPKVTLDCPTVLLYSGDPQCAVLYVLNRVRSQHCLIRYKTVRTSFKDTGNIRRVCC